jgi:predicted acetyltransferase
VVTADLPLRAATADDWDAVFGLLVRAFSSEYHQDEHDRDQGVFEPERALVAVDGEQVVANAAAYTRQLVVPGGAAVPAAHVTLVGVLPTYRRRGLLTRLMTRQLREVRDAGREPLAVLWASEGRIYQRYGYGLASTRLSLAVDGREVRLGPAGGTAGGALRDVELADARKDVVAVYERVWRDRPGWSSRDERWWDRTLSDLASDRGGATQRRALLFEGPDGVDGYALWRTRAVWDDGGPAGETQLREVVAATPLAYRELWRFLLAVDLTRTTRYWCAATDEPLLHLVNEPRRLGANLGDALWVRLVDVAAALAARRYAAPVDVVLEVDDALLPENAGRYRLRAGADAVTCEPTGDPADLGCDVAALGAAYLGGTSLATLAAGGRVRELRPGAAAEAASAFGWYRAPSAIEVF